MAYFRRLSGTRFLATEHVGGAWNPQEQHIAPALGLLVHCLEEDMAARREDALVIGRLSFDILGTVPIGEVTVSVEVLRRGRTIELVEATLRHGDRSIVLLRAWLMQSADTENLRATMLSLISPVNDVPGWDPTTVWPGGYIDSVEVRRDQSEPGRASFWVRTSHDLVDGEPTSGLAGAAAHFDIANGMTVRADPARLAFPNVDVTVHLFAQPRGEWLGFDTTVSFGNAGVGLTHSVLHDEFGPIGVSSQILTLRPL